MRSRMRVRSSAVAALVNVTTRISPHVELALEQEAQVEPADVPRLAGAGRRFDERRPLERAREEIERGGRWLRTRRAHGRADRRDDRGGRRRPSRDVSSNASSSGSSTPRNASANAGSALSRRTAACRSTRCAPPTTCRRARTPTTTSERTAAARRARRIQRDQRRKRASRDVGERAGERRNVPSRECQTVRGSTPGGRSRIQDEMADPACPDSRSRAC